MNAEAPPYDYTRSDGHVRIRPYRSDDVDAHYDAVRASADEVARWLPWCHPAYSRQESEAWIAARADAWAAGEAYSFAVIDADDGEFLGGCGLNHINRVHAYANLGYWIRTDAAGRGAATAAALLVARFGFEQVGLQRIEIGMSLDNHASRRVAEKTGAVREGVLRHGIRLNDEPQDALLFSLLPSDLK